MSATIAQMVDGVIVHRFELKLGVTTVGRKPENDIVIQDPAVSSAHAHFLVEKNKDFPQYIDVYVEDFGSTNGTFVNNLPVQKKQKLVNYDVVRFGFNEFRLMDDENTDMTRTVHMATPGNDFL